MVLAISETSAQSRPILSKRMRMRMALVISATTAQRSTTLSKRMRMGMVLAISARRSQTLGWLMLSCLMLKSPILKNLMLRSLTTLRNPMMLRSQTLRLRMRRSPQMLPLILEGLIWAPLRVICLPTVPATPQGAQMGVGSS